jgi:hypothetical protein
MTVSPSVWRCWQEQRQSFVVQTVSTENSRTDKCSARSTGEQREGNMPGIPSSSTGAI